MEMKMRTKIEEIAISGSKLDGDRDRKVPLLICQSIIVIVIFIVIVIALGDTFWKGPYHLGLHRHRHRMIDRKCHLFASNVDQNSWNTRHQMWNSPPHWNANGLHSNFHFQPTLNWTTWIFEKFPSVLKDQRNILEKKPVPPCNPIQDQGRSSFPNLNLLFTRKSSGKMVSWRIKVGALFQT